MKRIDRTRAHRAQYEKNRRIILKTQDVCAICARAVDKTLKFPNPLAPAVDHIIPINRGGHPSDLNNLQLAHSSCNRQKSDKLFTSNEVKVANNRNLPQLMDWASYRAEANKS